jgi:molybdopterin molybdotransferase
LIPLEEAQARLLGGVRATPAEIVSVAQAWGRVTAAPLAARLSHPPQDVSAMDGYAVVAAASPAGAALPVVGAAPAGHPWTGAALRPGQALRLFTGSLMPQGADTVLLQEDAGRDGERVIVHEAPEPGRHIRRAGQDFAAGEILIPAGRRLTARDVGLAAAANHPWLAVHRRPRVAILSTGDEISLPGDPLAPGGIVSSNGTALAALVRGAGAEPVLLPGARDDWDSLAAAIQAAAGFDMLLTVGGASVGDHDLVREALARQGMALDFWSVAMRPGKPLMHGRLGTTRVIGLPGNPVSALVGGIALVRPVIERLGGLPGLPPPTTAARLGAPLAANDRRADFLRARLDQAPDGTPVVTAFPRQDSGMLRTMAAADALILRAPHAPAAPVGATVRILPLDRFGL